MAHLMALDKNEKHIAFPDNEEISQIIFKADAKTADQILIYGNGQPVASYIRESLGHAAGVRETPEGDARVTLNNTYPLNVVLKNIVDALAQDKMISSEEALGAYKDLGIEPTLGGGSGGAKVAK